MKLYDFGLWFHCYAFSRSRYEWSTTIPQEDGFHIAYDGMILGWHSATLSDTVIYDYMPYIIRFKENFNSLGKHPGSPLSMDDFDIVPNHDYKEIL